MSRAANKHACAVLLDLQTFSRVPFRNNDGRVCLQPIMQEAAQLRSITALDTWVDDIGADFEACAVCEGYKTLRRLLEGVTSVCP